MGDKNHSRLMITPALCVATLLMTLAISDTAVAMPSSQGATAAGAVARRQAATPPTSADIDNATHKLARQLQGLMARQQASRLQARSRWTPSLGALPELKLLQQRLGGRLKVQGMGVGGVPRQIAGGILEPAAAVAGDRAQRDRTTATRFLTHQRRALRLAEPASELVLSAYREDELGRRHLRFHQQHEGIPVWPAEVIVHLDAHGNVDGTETGHTPSPRGAAPVPEVDRSTAERLAREAVDPDHQAATEPPELIFYAPLDGASRLGWKLNLDRSLRERWVVVVDAVNGTILHVHNRATDANVSGSGADLLGATRALDVWKSGSTHYLVDTSKAMFDVASAPPDHARGAIVVKDARNKPSGSNPDTQPDPQLFQVTALSPDGPWLKDGVSAAFNLAQTYDYFFQVHGRNSIDGSGGSLSAIVRYGQAYDNAFWSNPNMVFGTGDRYAAALDVVAHELTHGVTEHTANLVYQGQSGALNEALSDIFGEAVEARTTGQTDWLMGTDLQGQIRDLKNTARFGDPDRMSQYRALPITAAGDWGGVHTNSGIINHAFYLLAAGATDAIGMTKAEKIFYRAQTQHLVPNAQFDDMRRAAVSSAKELYGTDSPEAVATGSAFDAVELPDTGSNPDPTPIPTVSGDDATLCVYHDASFDADFICRRETAQGDPEEGVRFSIWPVARVRPAVSGDGMLAAFVNADHDLCLLQTDTFGSDENACITDLKSRLKVHSVAVSPDRMRFAFVFQDLAGNALNFISVIDMASPAKPKRYVLRAPVSEGNAAAIDYADAMDFSVDGRMLIYDAFNEFPVSGADPLTAWSIYAIDLVNGQFLTVVPPTLGTDIGNPSVGRAGSGHLTYEKQDPVSFDSQLWVADLNRNDHAPIVTVPGRLGVPHFTGDDKALVFSQRDDTTPTGSSLWQVPLLDDWTGPNGAATFWMNDADRGVIYRRGEFTGVPEFSLSVSIVGSGKVTSSPGGIDCGRICDTPFLQNRRVTLTAKNRPGWRLTGWSGCDSVAGTTCSVIMTTDRSASASFEPSPMSLDVAVSGNGEVVGSGILCDAAGVPKCSSTYSRFMKARLAAKPADDSVLERWEGCDTVVNQRCVLTVDAEKKVRAVFRLKRQFELNLDTTTGTGSGSIVTNLNGVSCSTCSLPVDENTALRLQAKADPGSRFMGWINCRRPAGNRCTGIMDGDETIQAIFNALP